MFSKVFGKYNELTFLIAQASSLDPNVRTKALSTIDKITTLAQEGKVPAEKLDVVFELFFLGAKNEDDLIKINSLFGIKCFVEQNKLCTGKIHQTLDLFIAKALDSEEVVRVTALSVIIELIKQNKLIPIMVKKVLDILVSKAQDINIDIAKNALFGINKLIEQNKLPADKILEILNLLINLNSSESLLIKKKAFFGIGELIKKNMIYAEKISEVIDLLIVNIRNISSDIKEKALFNLNNLLKKGDFFVDRIEEIMSLFIMATEDANIAIRVNGFFGINQLITKDPLLENKIERILSLFINGAKDVDICVRKESLFGISELIKYGKLPIGRIEESLNLFIEGTKDKYSYVQKEGFSGIRFLLEKDILPASATGLILDLFIEGLKHSDDILKREAILGIIKLIEKDQLLTLKIKIEEILNLLKTLTNTDNHDLVIHNAIIAIGKLAEKDIIPEYKIEEILDLLVTKKEDGTLLFVSITEAEKAEIASIMDGTIITKINTAHPSLNALIDQAVSFNDEVRASAISKLVSLIKKDKIPLAKIDEVLTLLISKIKDECDDVRNGALSGINVFIEKNKIPAVRVEEISNLYITGTRHINIDTRKNTLFGIAKLVEQNKLLSVKIEKILNIFISRVKDENVEIKKQALFGLLKIIEKGKFPVEKLEKIIDIFMEEARTTNADIKQIALRGLVMLEEQHYLPLEKTEEVLITFIAEASDIKADIKQNALRGLAILAERNKIHIDAVDEVLSIFMTETNNLREVIRKHALFGINQLIINDHIIPQKIQEILDLFIISAQDTKFIIKKNALYGMSKLVEKYQLLPERAEKILELFIAEVNNEQADIKRWVMLGINKLIEKKELPTSKTEEILELLIMHSKDDKPDISLSGLFGIGKLIEGYELSDIKAEEIISIFMIMVNSPDINVRNNILFWTTQLIEKNNFSIDKIKTLLDFFVAATQEVDIDIKNHGLFGISKLIDKNYISEDKISKILNIVIAASRDNDTKENALFAINALIRMDKLPTEIMQVQVVLDLFVESVKSENTSIRKNAIQLIESLIDNSKIQIDSVDKILIELERLIESELDIHIRHNLIIAIKKLVEHELIPENKIEKILDIFIAYKESNALFFDGMSAVETEEIASIADGTIISKMQAICSSLSFLIFQAKNPNNENRDGIIKKISLLILLNKIPAEMVDEVLSLFMVGIKDININVRKNSFSGINILIERDKIFTELMQDLFILLITEIKSKNADIKQNTMKLVILLISKNILTTEKIEEVLILLEEMAKGVECNDVRHNALVIIRELANRNVIPNNKIEEILNLFITLKESNALFFDGMSEAEIEEIASITDGTMIAKMQTICASISFITFKGKSLDNEVRASAIKQIVLLAQEDKIPEESLDEALMLLITSANDQYDIIKNDALIGIRELMDKNKISIETIDKILNMLLIAAKSTNTDIRVKSLFIIGDILEKYTLSIEKINEVMDLIIVKIRDIEDLAINNALWTIWILTEENKLPLGRIEEIWEVLIEARKISDHYIKKNTLLVMCKLINSDKISIEKISVIQDILIQENKELLGFRKVFYKHHNFLLSEMQKAINSISILSKSIAEVAIREEDTIVLQELSAIDIAKQELKMPVSPTTSLPIIPSELSELEKLSEEIANSVLGRTKLLLKATELTSDDIELEKEFVNELAMLLRVTHKKLLVSANSNKDLKSNLIKQIAAELKKSSKLYVDDEKFYIQEELRDDSLEFFNPIISKVKEILKQHEYFDTASGNILEVFYVTNIIYDNLMFNNPELLYEVYKIGGTKAINSLIDLGQDLQIGIAIIEATEQYGIKHVVNIMFSNQHAENAKLLKIDASADMCLLPYEQNSAVLRLQLDPLAISNEDKVYQTPVAGTLKYFITQFLDRLNLDISWQYKKFIYHQDLKQLREILQNNNIDRSIDVLRDYSDFRKSVLLKIHPDKGGNNDDFVFVKALQEKFSANLNLDIKTLLDDTVQTISSMVYKASIGFKILDAMVDTVRLAYEPTIDHTKKLTLDSAHIYSMYSGVNGYSLGISAVDILYQACQGEYLQALKQAATSMSYMALPSIIGYLGIPYLGFTYGAGMMVYTGYSSITNAYSLYQEYGSVEFYLRSATTYKDLTQVLANSPLQKIYDFMVISKEYSVKVNKINLNIEKTFIKTQLEAKGEFGQKLYEYIYKPFLEEKYDLLNRVIHGSLTQEEAKNLKAKHIQITTLELNYEHCLEIKSVEGNSNLEDLSEEHYYCYNEEQQVIEHIIIGESRGHIEVFERL